MAFDVYFSAGVCVCGGGLLLFVGFVLFTAFCPKLWNALLDRFVF